MVISRGSTWGEPAVVQPHWRVAHKDAQIRGVDPVLLAGGNIWRALGCPTTHKVGEECLVLPVDTARCVVTTSHGEQVVTAVSEIIIGSWWSRAGCTIISNSGILEGLNVTPRAHPNDGEWDVLSISAGLGLREKLHARRRARTGTHIPHPRLRTLRIGTHAAVRDRRARLMIDGVVVRGWTSVTITVVPDSAHVVV